MAWSSVATVGMVTAIGATIGAVGAITKNKTLSMLGAGMSLVGGISSFMSSSGASAGAAGADLIDDGMSAAGSATAGSAGAAVAPTVPMAGTLDTAAATMSPASFAGMGRSPAMTGGLQNAGAVDVASLSMPGVTAPAPAMQTAGMADDIAQYGGTTNAPYIDGSTMLPTDTVLSGGILGTSNTVGQLTSGKMAAEASMIDKFLNFTQKNPMITYAGMQLAGGAMQGEFNQEFLDLKKQEQDRASQKQQWGNSVPDITGLLGQAKKA